LTCARPLDLIPGSSAPGIFWRMHAQPTLLYVSTLPVDIQGDYTPGDTRFAGD
jgi:hypothetical protein